MKITGEFKVLSKKKTDNATYSVIGDVDTFDRYNVVNLPNEVGEVVKMNNANVSIQNGKFMAIIKPVKGE